MNSSAAVARVKVSADGDGVVSHAGVGLLREVADLTGLSSQVTAALADTYRGRWIHAPGAVFADLAAAVGMLPANESAWRTDYRGPVIANRNSAVPPATLWRFH